MLKKIFIGTVIFASLASLSYAAIPVIEQITNLLYNQTSAGTGSTYQFPKGVFYRTHQAVLYQSGVQAASGTVYASNDGQNWSDIWDFNLTNTNSVASSVTTGPWAMERATINGISGVASSVASINVTVAQ